MMSFDTQAAFRKLHAEADRLLPADSLEWKVMHGQLSWMRTLLMEREATSPEALALHQTMMQAKAEKQQQAEAKALAFAEKRHARKVRRVLGRQAA